MSAASELPAGMRVLDYATLASTNTEAMRLAALGDPGRVWIAADVQTAGRGRSGRSWQSVAGNLYASYLVRLDCSVMSAQALSLVAGVAALFATLAGLLSLLWFNRIL